MSEFRFPIRVYYEDTDAGGVVYHANYLRFAERARTEWLRVLGFDHQILKARFGLHFVVRRAQIDFRRPALLDDQLVVRTEILETGGARWTMAQDVLRDDDLLAAIRIELAMVDEAGRPKRIPKALLKA